MISSDHGDFNGDHGLVFKGHAGYDGVYRVPLIMHWPAGLRAGSREHTSELVDVLPTLLGLAGGGIPRNDWSRLVCSLLGTSEEIIGRPDALPKLMVIISCSDRALEISPL